MESKKTTVILSVILMIGIGLSIYQYNKSVELKNRLSMLKNNNNEIASEIESKKEELNQVRLKIEKANTTISELTAKKEKLIASNKEIQSKIDALKEESSEDLSDGINSTHTDIELGEDEYKGEEDNVPTEDEIASDYELTEEDQAIIDQIEQEIMAEHPEWFTDTAGNSNNSTGNYEHVGTPDTGELPGDFDMNGDFSELGDDVTVY